METYSIKCWAEDDRPREKLLAKGRKNLTTVELLAILLGSGTGKKSAIDLAHELFDLAHQDVNEVNTSAKKITQRFQRIESVELELKEVDLVEN